MYERKKREKTKETERQVSERQSYEQKGSGTKYTDIRIRNKEWNWNKETAHKWNGFADTKTHTLRETLIYNVQINKANKKLLTKASQSANIWPL